MVPNDYTVELTRTTSWLEDTISGRDGLHRRLTNRLQSAKSPKTERIENLRHHREAVFERVDQILGVEFQFLQSHLFELFVL